MTDAPLTDLGIHHPTVHWHFDAKHASGGAVIGVAVHLLDLEQFLLGAVLSVATAMTPRPDKVLSRADDYTVATPAVRDPRYGPALHVVRRAGSGVRLARDLDSRANEIFGGPPAAGDRLSVATAASSTMILRFAECCRTATAPVASGRDTIRTIETVFGIVASRPTAPGPDYADLVRSIISAIWK